MTLKSEYAQICTYENYQKLHSFHKTTFQDQFKDKLSKYLILCSRYHYSDDMRRWDTNESQIGIWLPRQVARHFLPQRLCT